MAWCSDVSRIQTQKKHRTSIQVHILDLISLSLRFQDTEQRVRNSCGLLYKCAIVFANAGGCCPSRVFMLTLAHACAAHGWCALPLASDFACCSMPCVLALTMRWLCVCDELAIATIATKCGCK
eukprot:15443220-Alexandrium_andersonii.AAC.1